MRLFLLSLSGKSRIPLPYEPTAPDLGGFKFFLKRFFLTVLPNAVVFPYRLFFKE